MGMDWNGDEGGGVEKTHRLIKLYSEGFVYWSIQEKMLKLS